MNAQDDRTNFMPSSAAKFDATRANEYAMQSRIALAGYDACHELAACLLSAELEGRSDCHLLIVGAGGTAQEIITNGKHHPGWSFIAVDPSAPMVDTAKESVAVAGLGPATTWHIGHVDDLPQDVSFHAATLIGVLHHLPGRAAKSSLLQEVASRLHPDGPLILACNRGSYVDQPLFLRAWGERWRMEGASNEEVEARRGKILKGAEPPASDADVEHLLSETGFKRPKLFFSSLFWGAWIARRGT